MAEPAKTIEGWYALHDFRRIRWTDWKTADPGVRSGALAAWHKTEDAFLAADAAREATYGAYAIAGHKADVALVHFRPTFEGLIACKTACDKTSLADYLEPVYSYVSIVELSGYLSRPDVPPEEDPRLLPRLRPALPDMPFLCFYPMNKRRDGADNWYMLDTEERTRMMVSHGQIGRTYAGQVQQIITGSMGLDDWEWGVTLFAHDPLAFKKLVYEMRFDEVSARFAEFGPFYVGKRMAEGGWETLLRV